MQKFNILLKRVPVWLFCIVDLNIWYFELVCSLTCNDANVG